LLAEVDIGFRSAIAKRLRVDRNGLYRVSKQVQRDAALRNQILKVRRTHRHYGYRRLAIELDISENRIQRVCQLYDLQAPQAAKQVKYRKLKGSRPAPRNVLLEDGIVAERPSHVWACDFTYLWVMGRWYYVATVIDLYTREIVGWNIGVRHDCQLILRALYDALSRTVVPGVLHFDRGSEYLSESHLDLCASLEITPSASHKGSPWQNGHQERFYGTFKLELGNMADIQSEGELFERIALTLNYYNTKRIHTKLKTNPRQHGQNYNTTETNVVLRKTEVRDKMLRILGG
jgi:transposase InsO family protein